MSLKCTQSFTAKLDYLIKYFLKVVQKMAVKTMVLYGFKYLQCISECMCLRIFHNIYSKTSKNFTFQFTDKLMTKIYRKYELHVNFQSCFGIMHLANGDNCQKIMIMRSQ